MCFLNVLCSVEKHDMIFRQKTLIFDVFWGELGKGI
jgi:hypothetical protein